MGRVTITNNNYTNRMLFFRYLLTGVWLSLASGLTLSSEPIASFSTAEVPPWGYEGPYGQPAGLLSVLAERLGAIAGIRITNDLRPYPRTIDEIRSGKVDFAIMFAGPSSESIGIPLGVVTDMDIILTGMNNHVPIESLNDMAGEFVGYIRGSLYGKVFESNSEIQKIPVQDMEQGLRMLAANRVAGMVGTDQALYHGLKNEQIDPLKVRPLLILGSAQAVLYFSRASNHKDFIKPFQDALQTMRESGELQDLFALPGKPAEHFVIH
ncbi:hypothetical protein BTA51_21515 [Hahella sp. CCB-MM4]|uniref:substrate-binding periplasmic protein n=1 Tax=Hahella sp. (strain CCB-MM4) TaxID=1926491 RepID=UPI000B9AD933|nr:transporter substrate-binding domain-containing protein [Hahella sp. CCB-MM4]OZG71230.1 hypothetical protein BTA51_21515 [Hahella sp. CCB-MM4]